MFAIIRSKTVWAAVAGAVAYLLSVPHVGPQEVVTAISSVLGVAGVRDAWAKGGKL